MHDKIQIKLICFVHQLLSVLSYYTIQILRRPILMKRLIFNKMTKKKYSILTKTVFSFTVIFMLACASPPPASDPQFPEDTEEYVPDTDTITVDTAVYAGQRSSRYGAPDPFPAPDYWSEAAKSMAAGIKIKTAATAAFVWIVGTITDQSCFLTFPSPGGQFTNVFFNETDLNEKYLTHFDQTGAKVWLQVEPASADVDQLIDLVLTKYSHHKSVIGFGVDVEWHRYNSVTAPKGIAVTDVQAKRWAHKVRSYNPSYLLFFKHWLIDKMPSSYRNGIMFLNDSQGFASLNAMVKEFAEWGNHFAPARVGFQFGYNADKVWWSKLEHAPSDIANALAAEIPNARDYYWVDFTIEEFWPVNSLN
jgi:hypothetical protein